MDSIRNSILHELESSIVHARTSESHELLNDNSVLLETGLDSLAFAVLVARLEKTLGYDPFTLDPNPIYPRTLGEFIDMYEKYGAHRVI